MTPISHELDEGFQKISLIMLALVLLYPSAAVLDATELFQILKGPTDDIALISFSVLNTLICFTKGWLRLYLGSTIVGRSYAFFLCTGLGGLTYLLANVIRETIITL